MKGKSTGVILYIAIFFLICAIPSLGMLAVGEARPAANETLPERPSLRLEDGTLNSSFFDDVTDYMGKRFAFRQELVTANAALNAGIFHHSSSEKVMMGEDDWLFYEETKGDYLRTEVLSEREVYGAVRSLKLLQDACAAQGRQFLFMIVPNKNSLYPEFMRNVGTPLNRKKNLELIREELQEQGVAFLDLEKAFQQQKEVLYFHMDSHWNNKGAAFAGDLILERLGRSDGRYFFQEPYTLETTHKGDLYEMLYPKGKRLEDQVYFQREMTFVDSAGEEQAKKADRMMIETSCNGKTGSLVMFRDSFGDALYPFLAEFFGRCVFTRKIPYDMTLIESIGAETALMEIVERNLDWLKRYPPVMAAPKANFTYGAGFISPEAGEEGAVGFSQESPLEGFLKVTGTYSFGGEHGQGNGQEYENYENTPIYIQTPGGYYEAFPAGDFEEENCFTAHLPADEVRGQALYLVRQDGKESWKKIPIQMRT